MYVCGDGLRGVVCAVLCGQYYRKLEHYFQHHSQYGSAVSCGIEIMVLTPSLGFKEGCTFLSYNGANGFNFTHHHRFLAALAEIVL